jgi:hypothetical protein
MSYQEKYEKRKKNILNLFTDCFLECNILNDNMFSLKSCEFKNARDEDDYIEFLFERNDNLYLLIHFWIHFWIDYKYDDNFSVTYLLKKKDSFNSHILLKNNISFKHLAGSTLNEKINGLCKKISKQIYQFQ